MDHYLTAGLAKIGVQPAFINTNLRAKGLLHCINVGAGKVLLVGCRTYDLITVLNLL